MITKLPYINEYRDRHGKIRRYFRRKNYPRVEIKGEPGTQEFLENYTRIIAQATTHSDHQPPSPGTVERVVSDYLASESFKHLSPSTQKMRRAVLKRFVAKHGSKRLFLMEPRHVTEIIASQKPFAAKNYLKTLRGLMTFAVNTNVIKSDPTQGIKPPKVTAGHIHTWTESEIARFEAKYPIGTKARLAMGLMLYTAQRRSDVIKLGPQHIQGDKIVIRQQKTKMDKTDRVLMIPIHPELRAILNAHKSLHLTFLVTDYGKPFSAAGFGNLFRKWCNDAGLVKCSAHGLRKAQLRRLAELGCTSKELQAISGHRSLMELQPYIDAADQIQLAESAIEKQIRVERLKGKGNGPRTRK
jgi:integrase